MPACLNKYRNILYIGLITHITLTCISTFLLNSDIIKTCVEVTTTSQSWFNFLFSMFHDVDRMTTPIVDSTLNYVVWGNPIYKTKNQCRFNVLLFRQTSKKNLYTRFAKCYVNSCFFSSIVSFSCFWFHFYMAAFQLIQWFQDYSRFYCICGGYIPISTVYIFSWRFKVPWMIFILCHGTSVG